MSLSGIQEQRKIDHSVSKEYSQTIHHPVLFVAIGAILCVAGIFIALAAHQVLPHTIHAISDLGIWGQLLGYSILLAGLAIHVIVMAKASVKNTDAEAHRSSLSCRDQESPQAATRNDPVAESIELNDEAIIINLEKQGYSRPKEEGGDGRCLFWSIVHQITPADVQLGLASKYAAYFQGWEALPVSAAGDDRLDRLRNMALAEEEDFLNSVSDSDMISDAFSPYQKGRVIELYQDMLQELERLSPEGVRQRLEANSIKGILIMPLVLTYCKDHFSAYKKATLRKHNWAGTSELISIGTILQREVQLFGRDLYPVTFDKEGNVLPYYSSHFNFPNTAEPILVFQCNGGGHYKSLTKRKSTGGS